MKKLRIVHIVSSLNVGGAERFVIDLSQSLKEESTDVEILSFGQADDTLCKVALLANIKVHNISNSSSIAGQFKLLKVLSQCDVIHLHTPRVIKTLSIILKLIGKKKFVYTRHGAADLSNSEWQNLHVKFRKYVSHMTFVSQEAMDVFKGVYPWPEISKEVVDNGVKIPTLLNKEDNHKILRIGSVGRFVALKNQICLLKAVASLPELLRNRVEVHLFGDGECEDQLRSFTVNELANQKIIFHGMVEDRGTIYNSFDLLCVTSETEGLSLAIMEAMAFGLPVLATNVGGNSKLVKHDVNGWLFSYDDHDVIANRIMWLFENRDALSELGMEGRKYIQETFSIKVASNKYVEIYKR